MNQGEMKNYVNSRKLERLKRICEEIADMITKGQQNLPRGKKNR